MKKQLEKFVSQDIPAWLSLILAAHRVMGRAKAMSEVSAVAATYLKVNQAIYLEVTPFSFTLRP